MGEIHKKMMPKAQLINIEDFGHNILLSGTPLKSVLNFLNTQ